MKISLYFFYKETIKQIKVFNKFLNFLILYFDLFDFSKKIYIYNKHKIENSMLVIKI